MNTKNIDAEELSEIFNYDSNTTCSEAIILAALSINNKNDFLPVKEYRENAFSVLWGMQCSTSSNWMELFRSELNQGDGRLAHRVFESPNGKGYNYKLKTKGIAPEDKAIITRLKKLLKTIEGGTSSIENLNDEEYQNKITWVKAKKSPEGPVKKEKAKSGSKSRNVIPKAGTAKAAIVKQKYICQINKNHKPFINFISGKNNVEGHHLIPMKFYNKYPYSIDIEDNIIALCPNCHREIHQSDIENIEKMLKKLLTKKRQESLKKKGILITDKKLLLLYK
jgi:predicted HNH restriction endonuclease